MAFWNRRSKDDGSNPLAYTPVPTPDRSTSAVTGPSSASSDPTFHLEVTDVFKIAGRGTVVTGEVARGTVGVGDALRVTTPAGANHDTTCDGVEIYREKLERATVGMTVGLLVRGLDREQIPAGSQIHGV